MSGSNSSAPTDNAPAEPSGAQPLGLTIHGLPATDAALTAQQRSGRWQMLAVLLVCAAPVIASYFTYYVIRPEGRRNWGTLIAPQRALPPLAAARALDGSVRPLGSLRGQWLLVSVAPGACPESCQQHLYLQRQLRESMGRDKDRVDWVWLISDDTPPPAALAPALVQATVLHVDAHVLAAWLQPEAGQTLVDHLYVVDPLGHWMMRFPPHMDTTAASKAKRDIERLLRASNAWDKAGRMEPAQ